MTADEFKNSLEGELIQKDDAGYDEARAVYNAMIDKRPAMIAKCANVADVQAAIRFARESGMRTAIRGGQDRAEEVFKPIRAFEPPALDGVGPLPHPAVQSMFDPLYPPGLQWYWRADFMGELSDDAIAEHARFGAATPTMHSTMHMYPINGAAARPSNTDTPWAYRDATWAQVMVGVDPDPANNDKIVSWTKDYFDAVHPYSAGGAYVNFMMEEGQERVQATYGDNYARLARIKKQYDPDNFFNVNQNIRP